MKNILALVLVTLTFANQAQAWGKRDRQVPPPAPHYVSREECSANLYSQLGTFESLTDQACSYGRTDFEFQRCTVELARYKFGDGKVDVAGFFCAKGVLDSRVQDCTLQLSAKVSKDYQDYFVSICSQAVNPRFAECAADMYINGGQEFENLRATTDVLRLCRNQTNFELNTCIKDGVRRGQNSDIVARACLEKHDPEIKARREAQRRAAEQARLEEQRRQQEAQRVAEQRRIEAQREAQRRAEEQRRLEEQRRQSQTQNQEQVRRQEELRKQEEARKKAEEQKRKQEEDKKKGSSSSSGTSTGSTGSTSTNSGTGSTTKTEEPGVIPPPPTTTIDDLPAFDE